MLTKPKTLAGANLSGIVLRARSGFYTVQTDDGLVECRLRGILKKERQGSDIAVIGDRVGLVRIDEASGVIESIEQRRSRFSRKQPGPRGTWREDVLVANLDQALVVFACADPMPHLRMLDRLLVVAEYNDVEAVIVVNKLDLCGPGAAEATFGGYRRIGYPVEYISARQGVGVEELRRRLEGRVSVVVGPSGVGKSTLLNAIQPGLRLDTGFVSDALHKGRHTTTTSELHPLEARGEASAVADGTRPGEASGRDDDAGGSAGEGARQARGYIADTPGLRELGLFRIPDSELASCFREMRPYLGSCGFNDCAHLNEPRCAVRAAVAEGAVPAERFESYRRLRTGEA